MTPGAAVRAAAPRPCDGAELGRVERAMGTVFSMSVRAPEARRVEVEQGLVEAAAWLHEVDRRFTTYQPDSEWLRFVRDRRSLDEVHPDIRHVATACAELGERTRGAFDTGARRDRPADPAAYVKGWAVSRAADILVAAGAETVFLNGGGDIVVTRREVPWRIGIQDPFHPARVVAVVELEHGAVATSGAYERGAHLYDPATGAPAGGCASVTVTGPDLGAADAYSTAIYASPRTAPEWFADLDDYGAFVVGDDGTTSAWGTLAPLAAAPHTGAM